MKSHFPELIQAIEAGMAIGLHLGAVVHVKHRGEVVADFAVGAGELDPVTPLRVDQRLLWLSAGKPLTALAIGILSDRGRISFDETVANFIPDFARHGKAGITVRHLLTHMHAYQPPKQDWPRLSREQIIRQICDASLVDGEVAGQYAAYDPLSGWYLLSEIVERVTGQANYEFVRTEVLEPLGCDTASIGMPADEWTAARLNGELALLHDTTATAREMVDLRPESIECDSVESRCPAVWPGESTLRAAAHHPGGGAMGTAKDLATVYQCLLDAGKTPNGLSLLRSSTVEELTSRQRIGLKDNSFGQVVDWGLGFLINSRRYGAAVDAYGYGQYASDNTFGHGGMQSSSAYADPDNQLAVAIIFNGLPGEAKHQKRVYEVNSALYRDLGLPK